MGPSAPDTASALVSTLVGVVRTVWELGVGVVAVGG